MYTQANVLSEDKDSSKNLVSGEFERGYRGGARARRGCGVAGVWCGVAACAAWLLVLTVLRELQLARLRRDVADLSASLLAVDATVHTLQQKISNNRLFDEFKTLEDTIYADEDISSIPVEDHPSGQDRQSFDPQGKLDGLTVLEDDDDDDDGDDLDDEDYGDEESGDYYPDYDKHKMNSNMLKSEDLSGSVVTLGGRLDNSEKIREIKRMLNENPEMPDIALAALTPPAHAAQNNAARNNAAQNDAAQSDAAQSDATQNGAAQRRRRSVFPDSPLDAVDEFAAPRMIKNDQRRVPKKFSLPATEAPLPLAVTHASRIARNSEDEVGQRRPFIAAHFHGNTSHLNTQTHEHYKGNGLVRLAHGAHHDVWYPSPWTLASPRRPTLTQSGHVHVHHTGVYLVYVQIYYLDSHDVISWVLHRTNPSTEGRDTLLQCAQTSHSSEPVDRPNSCYSAAALFLRQGDRLAVRNTGGSRHSLMQPEKSFIGLVQLADTIEPDQEL
ncbi:hypothetical protein JYU34_003195 [Plutella xylostella]|uniref:THD domain-containing protein n=1 Tax=Plutella xylostella TaxID=51655 RepID=A0ABQ7QZD6_PLUXY|nr:hypothetical protein JYU34_003195 [Plutella xylostella]